MSSPIISNANNFSEFISSGVDPRTGMYSLSLSIYSLFSHKTSGARVDLSLSYNAASSDDFGFGRGWSIPISCFDKTTQMLYLSSGQNFKIQYDNKLKEYVIPYRKLQDIKVFYVDATAEIKVCHKDGTEEYLDYDKGLLRRVISSNGLQTYFDYSPSKNKFLLTKVYDSSGAEINLDWYSSRWQSIIEKKVHGNSVSKIYLDKIDNPQRLHRVSYQEEKVNLEIKYRLISSGYDLIEQVIHPSGLIESINYRHEGHSLPVKAPLSKVPYVTRYCCKPGDNQPDYIVEYRYSDKNYLGFGSDQAWVAGEDTLFRANSNYQYTSVEIINGRQRITRTYNKYHLVASAEYMFDGELYRHERNVYFANLNLGIKDQPPQYSLLKEEFVTHYCGGRSNTLVAKYDYDIYGNQIYVQSIDGIKIKREFYPVGGEKALCPPSPNGMVSFLKREKFIPINNDNDEQIRETLFFYKKMRRLDDANKYFVVCSEQVVGGRKLCNLYFDELNDALKYGRVKQQIKYINGYEQSKFFEYIFSDETLEYITTLSTYDSLTLKSSFMIRYHDGLLIRQISHDDVITEYVYDDFGRIIEDVYAPGTINEAKTKYKYSVGRDQNSVEIIDPKGNISIQQLNNSGQVISISLVDDSGVVRPISTYEYNCFGLCVKRFDIDWFDNKEVQLTTAFEYDKYGQVSKLTHPDGRVECYVRDLALFTLKYEMPQLLVVDVKYTSTGKELTKTTLSGSGLLLAKTENKYDGYGRQIETKDVHGHVVTTSYDTFDRIKSVRKKVGSEVLVEDFTYADFAEEPLVTQKNVNGITIGERSYDGLARLKSEGSASGFCQFSYNPSSILPSGKLNANGENVDILNDINLQLPIAINGREPMHACSYKYDPVSGDLLEDGNINIQHSRQYNPRGHMISETISYLNGHTSKATYEYSLRGQLLQKTDFFNQRTFFVYDSFGRLEKICSHGENNTDIIISYDTLSRIIGYEMFNGKDKVVIRMDLNELGLETSRLVLKNGERLLLMTQEFNDDFLVCKASVEKNNNLTAMNMYYDDWQRLILVSYDSGDMPSDEYGNVINGQRFYYDFLGNICRCTTHFVGGEKNEAEFKYDSNNPIRLVSISNSHCQYDDYVELKYDASGNMIADDRGFNYQYNEFGQVAGVTVNGSLISTYHYDALGQVSTQYHDDSFINLYYQGMMLVNEYSDGVHSSYQGITSAIIGRTVSDDKLTQTQILVPNAKGSIVKEFTRAPDGSQAHKEYHYTVYGRG